MTACAHMDTEGYGFPSWYYEGLMPFHAETAMRGLCTLVLMSILGTGCGKGDGPADSRAEATACPPGSMYLHHQTRLNGEMKSGCVTVAPASDQVEREAKHCDTARGEHLVRVEGDRFACMTTSQKDVHPACKSAGAEESACLLMLHLCERAACRPLDEVLEGGLAAATCQKLGALKCAAEEVPDMMPLLARTKVYTLDVAKVDGQVGGKQAFRLDVFASIGSWFDGAYKTVSGVVVSVSEDIFEGLQTGVTKLFDASQALYVAVEQGAAWVESDAEKVGKSIADGVVRDGQLVAKFGSQAFHYIESHACQSGVGAAVATAVAPECWEEDVTASATMTTVLKTAGSKLATNAAVDIVKGFVDDEFGTEITAVASVLAVTLGPPISAMSSQPGWEEFIKDEVETGIKGAVVGAIMGKKTVIAGPIVSSALIPVVTDGICYGIDHLVEATTDAERFSAFNLLGATTFATPPKAGDQGEAITQPFAGNCLDLIKTFMIQELDQNLGTADPSTHMQYQLQVAIANNQADFGLCGVMETVMDGLQNQATVQVPILNGSIPKTNGCHAGIPADESKAKKYKTLQRAALRSMFGCPGGIHEKPDPATILE
jgi:hypothetical protein